MRLSEALSVWDGCACEGTAEHVFHPQGGPGCYDEARLLCTGCDTRAVCLLDALLMERNAPSTYRHGMRGGLTPSERARYHRRDTVTSHYAARRFAADLSDIIRDVVRYTPDQDVDRAILAILSTALTERGL